MGFVGGWRFTVHCTLYSVHCTLYIVYSTLYTVHCTLYLSKAGFQYVPAAERGAQETWKPSASWPLEDTGMYFSLDCNVQSESKAFEELFEEFCSALVWTFLKEGMGGWSQFQSFWGTFFSLSLDIYKERGGGGCPKSWTCPKIQGGRSRLSYFFCVGAFLSWKEI